MDTRTRLKLIRMTSLAENHPSFAKSIGIHTTLENKTKKKKGLKNESKQKENFA